MRPLAPPRGPWRFVVASDAHFQRPGEPLGRPEDLDKAIAEATGGTPTPRFVIVAGDLMQNSDPDEGEVVERAFDTSPAPLVPVEGNHDSYDGGREWRRRFGPELYSFEQGGVHVMVLDSMRPVHELIAFAAQDLATRDPDARVIAVTHGPPEIELADALDALGVEVVLAGHWHVNRTLHRDDGTIELDTEPWIMGGMDQSPGGYRIVEVEPGLFGAKAALRVTHETTTEVPIASLVGPAPGQCVPPDAPVPIIVALAGGPDLEPPRVTVDGSSSWITLARAGGWDWVGTWRGVARGRHRVTIHAGRSKRDYDFEACAPRVGPIAPGSWPQLGGNPGRTGASLEPLGDRLAPRWVAATGGLLGGGSPVIAGGLVIVAPIDLADDQTSAVVALDLATTALV
jgi:predicted phosphodiesterase